MDFSGFQDSIFVSLTERVLSDHLERAKSEFVKLTGPFDEEDEFFEAKLANFRDWFLFFFEIQDRPVLSFLDDLIMKEVGDSVVSSFKSSVQSVFVLRKVRGDTLYIRDLFTRTRYQIKESPFALSLEKGGYFQSSLFQFEDAMYLGQSLLAHPYEARRFIDKGVKKINKQIKKGEGDERTLKLDFMSELIAMKYQLVKYKQLKVVQIYSENSPIKDLYEKK